MIDEIIIYQPWGGLGDNLAHSLIPELCHERGIKCFLSKHNAVRNQQIYDLVWGLNPFIEKEKGDSTDLTWSHRCNLFEKPGQLNHIQVVQEIYGFNTSIEYPKIYYKPNLLPEFKNQTILDLSIYSIAKDYNPQVIVNILKNFDLDENTLSVTHSQVSYGTHFDTADKFKKIDINDLMYYSDVLLSCKRFITLYSGPSNLAPTIKHLFNTDTEIFVLIPRKYDPKFGCHYTYSNTNYIFLD